VTDDLQPDFDMQPAQPSQTDDWRAYAGKTLLSELEAIDKLNNEMENAIQFQNFATEVTASTLNLAAALSALSSNRATR
jgi:hypothetical protein